MLLHQRVYILIHLCIMFITPYIAVLSKPKMSHHCFFGVVFFLHKFAGLHRQQNTQKFSFVCKLHHLKVLSEPIRVQQDTLTHCSRETSKRVIGKQCRPRSDAAEHCV